MDTFYNVESAAQRLERIAEREALSQRLASCLSDNDIWKTSKYRLMNFPRLKSWRLCQYDGNGDAEEALFRVQGVLCEKNLPPLQKKSKLTESDMRARRFLRQSVKVSGLGTAQFAKAVANLEVAHLTASNSFVDGRLQDYEPAVHNSFQAIEAGARYFTLKKDDECVEGVVSFADGVDPHGGLAQLMSNNCVHTEDNQVDYFESIADGVGGSRRFSRVSPTAFRIGDIVEIAFSMSCIPLKGGRTKLLLLLRALVLLSQEDRNSAAILRMRSRYPQPLDPEKVAGPTLKRKAPYSDEVEEELAEHRFNRMRIE
ncbi:hypothetical protein BKA70DRAFT_1228126 [Coprinopsis sp. MPI-PUGE-AT-0042]|nr:hypothetical protein BKA70DRAFT_1228126 [Coprinopsis sp. MPI-PUGE-AT-0042]